MNTHRVSSVLMLNGFIALDMLPYHEWVHDKPLPGYSLLLFKPDDTWIYTTDERLKEQLRAEIESIYLEPVLGNAGNMHIIDH